MHSYQHMGQVYAMEHYRYNIHYHTTQILSDLENIGVGNRRGGGGSGDTHPNSLHAEGAMPPQKILAVDLHYILYI